MIQIDMPMPDSCYECRFETRRGFCTAMPDTFCGYTNDEGRPEWCPLKEQTPHKETFLDSMSEAELMEPMRHFKD